MAKEIKRKETFGGATVDHIRPKLPDGMPPALNIVLSFEEALKLHLSLGQLLGQLNSYNRSTTAGKQSAANLCLFTEKLRITVNEDKVRKPTA